MKYLKTYELLNRQPKIGDYVICSEHNSLFFSGANNILENEIGRIVGKNCLCKNYNMKVVYS